MEVYDTNYKSFAKSKRQRKYSTPRDKKKADPNGQRMRKVLNNYHDRYSKFRFEKTVNGKGVDFEQQTEFEELLGIQMEKKYGCEYSLNRNRNWSKINQIIQNKHENEKYIIKKGKRGTKDECGRIQCDIVKLGYFEPKVIAELNSNEDEDVYKEKNMILNGKIPGIIISIEVPSHGSSDNKTSWTHYGTRNYCNCCSPKLGMDARRQRRKTEFKLQIKRLQHVKDYRLDDDLIMYHPTRWQYY